MKEEEKKKKKRINLIESISSLSSVRRRNVRKSRVSRGINFTICEIFSEELVKKEGRRGEIYINIEREKEKKKSIKINK